MVGQICLASDLYPVRSRILVYHALYNVPLARRLLDEDWIIELKMQQHTMSKLLSFVLRPCVDRILSFIELGDAGREVVYGFWALTQVTSPSMAKHIVAFVDERHVVRRLLTRTCMKCFWDVYVGRLPRWEGCTVSWTKACQEIVDYLECHSRASGTRAKELLRSEVSALIDAERVAFWESCSPTWSHVHPEIVSG